MRNFISNQPESGKTQFFGVTPIEEIVIDPYCRDEISKHLRGLQEIYKDKETLNAIRRILEKMIPEETSLDKGRKGMDLWTIFLLGMLRLNCNCDSDKLKNLLDNHKQVRQMASIDSFLKGEVFTPLQTIHDNVSLFSKETANQINEVIVKFSHQKLFPRMKEIKARCDSFVFLSNVHFPTDFNLLKDSIKGVIRICRNNAEANQHKGWREHESWWEKIRSYYNTLSKMRNSNSKKQEKKDQRTAEIHAQVKKYLDMVKTVLSKAKLYQAQVGEVQGLEPYVNYTEKFINQIERRVFEGEKIPQDEKIYSIFEPYTEWICKGKAGVRQELGVKVGIIEDQYGFILDHRVMFKEQDKDVAFIMAKHCQEKFPQLVSISFDKGYHSKKDKDGKNNRTRIKDELGIEAILPVKGRRNKEDQERESSKEFVKARKQHSAVESGINALESHGLDRCPDRGQVNFERYAATGILATNLHKLGAILMARELKELQEVKKSG